MGTFLAIASFITTVYVWITLVLITDVPEYTVFVVLAQLLSLLGMIVVAKASNVAVWVYVWLMVMCVATLLILNRIAPAIAHGGA